MRDVVQRSVCEAVPSVLSTIFATRQIFFFSFSSRPLLVRLRALRALRDVVLFRLGGGYRDVDGEGDRRLCRLSFSFSFQRPLLGEGPSLSEVVAAWLLS